MNQKFLLQSNPHVTAKERTVSCTLVSTMQAIAEESDYST